MVISNEDVIHGLCNCTRKTLVVQSTAAGNGEEVLLCVTELYLLVDITGYAQISQYHILDLVVGLAPADP